MLHTLHERESFQNILEIGSGSGILSVIAAQIWQAPVLAVDIIEKAVADTAALARQNGLENLITAARSNGLGNPLILQCSPYDLIIGNLVAETLIRLAADIKKSLAPGGYVLLSGTLEWLAQDVEAAYSQVGLKIMHKNSRLSWSTYVLCHEVDT
jgi:ribosomal protein L11 methyltransferase